MSGQADPPHPDAGGDPHDAHALRGEPAPGETTPCTPSLAEQIAAWRERGADVHDPVRWRFIEAMARRAEAQQGDVRRLLTDRLATLLADGGATWRGAERPAGTAATVVSAPACPANPPVSSATVIPRSALAVLLDHLASQTGPIEAADHKALSIEPPPARPPELKTLTQFKTTWTQLSAQRRLQQSLAHVPPQAGPLNSQQLVHRSLRLMNELSPGYLQRFLGYVDGLSWVDQVHRGAPLTSTPAASARGKSARQKSG